MFLKELTLRGFKSFADKTSLVLEPGVTVVVGPNGSGKSNLVDAVAWVLGAQGPRTMRGAKMDDVIFAGASQRSALGRAEVSLTIDNSARLLPIEFTEVTITRTLFRSGESEYRINGAPCRLLDIQELLSDSGIGRQQHVIVGQGQLDAVLTARPEDRRAIIEEAAGVLKFRKRRERAERRLEATEANLLRLQDLLREVRRGLGPLARQADAARRHDGIADELRAIRLHLLGHELAGLQARLERLRDGRRELATRDGGLRRGLAELDVAVLEAEASLGVMGDDELADAMVRVETLRERSRGLSALLDEKHRGVERELTSAADEGVVESLVADASALRAELASADQEARALEPLRHALADSERRAAALSVSASPSLPDGDPDHELAAAGAERDALASALLRGTDELARLQARAANGEARAARLAAEAGELADALAAARSAQPTIELGAADADSALQAAEAATIEADARARDTADDAAAWRARADALALALDEARVAAGAEGLADLDGVAGPLVDHLEIADGAEAAVASALGEAMRAVVVRGGDAARRALARCKQGDLQALLLVLDDDEGSTQTGLAPPGTRPLAETVHASLPGLQAALERLLAGVVLVDAGWRAAFDLAVSHPGLVTVTPAGDRFGGRGPWQAGGVRVAGATQAALDEAAERAARAESARAAAHDALSAARRRADAARAALADARDARRRAEESTRELEAAIERLGDARRERAIDDSAIDSELAALRARHDRDTEALGLLDERIAVLARLADDTRRVRNEALAQADAAAAAAAEVVERRRDLEVREAAVGSRRAMVMGRLSEVEDRLARHPEAQAAAERHRAGLVTRARALGDLRRHLAARSGALEGLHAELRERRRRRSATARAATERLEVLRGNRAGLERELGEARERMSRAEVEEAETRLRLEQLVERLRNEFDCEPAAALDAVAPAAPEGTTLAGRARELDRELRLLGPVNPLALQEHSELEERHAFLVAQLEDVKSSRRELQRVIRAVDIEIVTVFETAFADVSRHFEDLFATLFPGGQGRLVLTDPADMLRTGIDVEARPSGKNLRRLSLLSGGERSLTALAFLFAVFRSRPSPFYLLDEVEAALDDVNLHRFLDLLEEFRTEAQLLVVSHQKRTMEAADCLYGVSMPPGGSSRVVSQRLRGADEIVLDAPALTGPSGR